MVLVRLVVATTVQELEHRRPRIRLSCVGHDVDGGRVGRVAAQHGADELLSRRLQVVHAVVVAHGARDIENEGDLDVGHVFLGGAEGGRVEVVHAQHVDEERLGLAGRVGGHGAVVHALVDLHGREKIAHAGLVEIAGHDARGLERLVEVRGGEHRAVERGLKPRPLHLVQHEVGADAGDHQDHQEHEDGPDRERAAFVLAEPCTFARKRQATHLRPSAARVPGTLPSCHIHHDRYPCRAPRPARGVFIALKSGGNWTA